MGHKGTGRFTSVTLGTRYGSLRTLEWRPRPDGKNGRAVLVQCDCGTQKILYPYVLLSGNTRSCGCWRATVVAAEACAAWQRFPGEAACNHLYASYRSAARRRTREWQLTKDEFRSLTRLPCYYCGTKPSKEYRTLNGCNGTYIYNGIDRKDNSRGYTLNNSVPCCFACNRMKGVMDAKEFIAHAQAISAHASHKAAGRHGREDSRDAELGEQA